MEIQAITYLDFEITIGRKRGDQHRMTVMAPAGSAEGYFVSPFTREELREKLRALGMEVRGTSIARKVARAASSRSIAQEIGRKLFEDLFRDEILTCYRESWKVASSQENGLRLRLNIVPELASLPWEFLYDAKSPAGYLCLSERTPVIRVVKRSARPAKIEFPMRIWMLGSNPLSARNLNLIQEEKRIQTAWKELKQSGQVEVRELKAPSLSDLQKLLLDRTKHPHVLHFMGHGGPNEILIDDGVGGGKLLDAESLRVLLADVDTLQLVVLNACEAGTGFSLSNLATTVAKAWIPAVVAMQFEISDKAAIFFAQGFYTAYAKDFSVDTAVTWGRKMIHAELGDTMEWGTPVVYMVTGETTGEAKKIDTTASSALISEGQRLCGELAKVVADLTPGTEGKSVTLAMERGRNYLESTRDNDKGIWDVHQQPFPAYGQVKIALALLATGHSKDSKEMAGLRTWLLSMQNPRNGSWGNDARDTSLALAALSALGLDHDDQRMKKGTRWLFEAQGDSGYWVLRLASKEEEDLAVLAAECLTTLAKLGKEKTVQFQRGVEFVKEYLRGLQPDRMDQLSTGHIVLPLTRIYPFISDDVEIIALSKRVVDFIGVVNEGGQISTTPDGEITQTAYALEALVLFPLPSTSSLRQAAESWLEAVQNPDGGWGWGLDEPSDPFATAIVLLALSKVPRVGGESLAWIAPRLDKLLSVFEQLQNTHSEEIRQIEEVWQSNEQQRAELESLKNECNELSNELSQEKDKRAASEKQAKTLQDELVRVSKEAAQFQNGINELEKHLWDSLKSLEKLSESAK